MNTKTLSRVEIKDADKGIVEAVFASFNTVDKDGDVTLPGAFDDGATVAVSAYGHTSWEGRLPVGFATIRQTDTEAVATAQFLMDTQHGAETFRTVKSLHSRGLGEWSYGYDVLEHSFGEHEGRKVRFLRKQLVHEVSPVLVGAGVGTRTLSAKAGHPSAPGGAMTYKTAIRPHETDVVNRAWDRDAVVSAVADDASVSDLRTMAAWVDPGGDPETKDAYRFWHHHGPGGAANVRACITGIAVLNGARGVDTSAADWSGDREGIYSHLAAHIRDADREPPQLRAAEGSTKLDLRDEVASALAGVAAVVDSTERVVALRAAKGKQLSKINAEYLDWLDEDLMALHRKLRSYIDSPDDDAVREYVRFVQNSLGGRTP